VLLFHYLRCGRLDPTSMPKACRVMPSHAESCRVILDHSAHLSVRSHRDPMRLTTMGPLQPAFATHLQPACNPLCAMTRPFTPLFTPLCASDAESVHDHKALTSKCNVSAWLRFLIQDGVSPSLLPITSPLTSPITSPHHVSPSRPPHVPHHVSPSRHPISTPHHVSPSRPPSHPPSRLPITSPHHVPSRY
jgi:hypothetical protein